MALKRSLEEVEGAPKKQRSALYTPSLSGKSYFDGDEEQADTAASTKQKPRSRRQQRRTSPNKEAPIIKLVPIDKCIQNNMVSRIEKAGFVEISQVLPSHFINLLRSEAEDKLSQLNNNNNQKKASSDGFTKISNALQLNVSKNLAEKISLALMGSDKITDSMKLVFGQSFKGEGGAIVQSSYDGFVVESLKLLITRPGSPPQLPHADDHCTSCLVGIVHLKDNQLRTRIAKYNNKKDYPTGISVACDSCHRDEQLPDVDYKRGVHLTTEKWYCGHCNMPARTYDFEQKLTHSFNELLHDPNMCNAYAGGDSPKANDGILALPTLIHCGPGNPSSSTEDRIVLFFTVRPLYKNIKADDKEVEKQHRYNEDLQIHAPCILYNQFQKTIRIYENAGCNLRNYSSFIVGANAADLSRLKTDLARARSTIASQERKIERLMLRLGEGSGDGGEKKEEEEEGGKCASPSGEYSLGNKVTP
jgi:hypothetical protein